MDLIVSLRIVSRFKDQALYQKLPVSACYNSDGIYKIIKFITSLLAFYKYIIKSYIIERDVIAYTDKTTRVFSASHLEL